MKNVAKMEVRPALISGTDLRIDLGCGDNKRKDGDWLGVDKFKTDSTDYTFDLFEFPWPIETGSVAMFSCSHFFEHVPAMRRVPFMDECFRCLKVGGQLVVIVPHYNSMRAVQDFTHEWPPICESSFLYFNKGWREQNKLTHGAYSMNCDFDFSYGFQLDNDIQVRNIEFQQFALKHYSNTANDLHVTLTRRG
jgi:SAM-dependent methyltransferase